MLPIDPDEAVTPNERRRSDRKKLVVDVKFEGQNSAAIANTRDIGIGGLYITTDGEFSTGDEIEMDMALGGKPFNVKGVVAYADPGVGLGVRFKDLDAEQVQLLKSTLEIG